MDRHRLVHMDHSLFAAIKMHAAPSAKMSPVGIKQNREQPKLGSCMGHAKLQFSIITHRPGSKQETSALTAVIMHGNKINMVKFYTPDSVQDQVPTRGLCGYKLFESRQD